MGRGAASVLFRLNCQDEVWVEVICVILHNISNNPCYYYGVDEYCLNQGIFPEGATSKMHNETPSPHQGVCASGAPELGGRPGHCSHRLLVGWYLGSPLSVEGQTSQILTSLSLLFLYYYYRPKKYPCMHTSLLQIYKIASPPPLTVYSPPLWANLRDAFLLFLPEELILKDVFVCPSDVIPTAPTPPHPRPLITFLLFTCLAPGLTEVTGVDCSAYHVGSTP